ncbi:hypothetical protein A3216_11970 [Mycobacterium leprae 7935681]|uniref:hypothetical protein n=1 Tax=Mycobacterium leprae TaxID=1769 RepID=UPI0007DAF403|nr:hypothetical protein [Mycobacterium leprae]OAX70439.1 hypothetical protein A3216_11970 [Mycobacterium leprae 7935681]
MSVHGLGASGDNKYCAVLARRQEPEESSHHTKYSNRAMAAATHAGSRRIGKTAALRQINTPGLDAASASAAETTTSSRGVMCSSTHQFGSAVLAATDPGNIEIT